MKQKNSFRFCPRCGRRNAASREQAFFHCRGCGFCLYFNTATAVACFLMRDDGRLLFIRRANNPRKGKLSVPGGFVDSGESAEQALRREMFEEVNIRISGMEYLCSFPNMYNYRGITYSTVDIFFTARLSSGKASAMDEVASISWMKPCQVKTVHLAFPSVRKAWKCWLKNFKQ